MFNKKEFIQRLAAIPKRGAATKGEREAANYIFELMRSMGFATFIETFKTPTRMPVIHFIHFFLLFLASLAANLWPLGAVFVATLVIISFWGEFTHRFFILRHLTPHALSQNVYAKFGPDDATHKIVFSAHMDAARGGLIFHPKTANAAGMLKNQPLHKSLLIAMLILLTVFIVKAFHGQTWVLSVVFNTIAFLSLVASLLMVEWEMAPYVAGANDDLSAVAVMLGVAEKLKDTPLPGLQCIFVATGAEEPHCNGMRSFLKAHEREFDSENTYFINLECLGGGRLKYVTQEGFIIFQKHDHTLIQIAEIVARKYMLDFQPTYTVAHSESIVPLTKGFKSIGLIALNENNIPTNYHQLSDTEDKINYDALENAETALLKMVDVIEEFRRLEYI